MSRRIPRALLNGNHILPSLRDVADALREPCVCSMLVDESIPSRFPKNLVSPAFSIGI
jgi:hypothetical protein